MCKVIWSVPIMIVALPSYDSDGIDHDILDNFLPCTNCRRDNQYISFQTHHVAVQFSRSTCSVCPSHIRRWLNDDFCESYHILFVVGLDLIRSSDASTSTACSCQQLNKFHPSSGYLSAGWDVCETESWIHESRWNFFDFACNTQSVMICL